MKTSLPINFLPVVVPVIFAVTMAVAGFAQTSDNPPQTVRWESDMNVAAARAERENRPIFIHFCLPSQSMETEVFVLPHIASHLQANFVLVKINASENAALAQKFSVTVVPTDIILKPDGQLVHRRVGEITADRFADYLAFLQKTLLQSTVQPVIRSINNPALIPSESVPFPATNPPSSLHSTPSPVVAPPSATSLPRQEMPLTAGIPRDPFGGQQLPDGKPVATTPELAAYQTVPHYVPDSPQDATRLSTPPVVASPVTASPTENAVPSITALLEATAPTKMMVEVPIALEGFCPVTLGKEERWVTGNPAFCTMYQGHVFRFASPEALETFVQNPANYIPVAMGEDIVLLVDRNKRVNGNRVFGAWYEERVFLFSSQETLDVFAARPEYYREIALKYETARKTQSTPGVY